MTFQSSSEKRAERRANAIIALCLATVIVMIAGAFYLDGRGAKAPQPVWDTKCVVTRVVDGDTIECDDIPVRLLGFDSPEMDWSTTRSRTQGPGYEAQQALIEILGRSRATVGLRFEKRLGDVYGRVLAHVYLLDGRAVGELMIQAGHATYRESY